MEHYTPLPIGLPEELIVWFKGEKQVTERLISFSKENASLKEQLKKVKEEHTKFFQNAKEIWEDQQRNLQSQHCYCQEELEQARSREEAQKKIFDTQTEIATKVHNELFNEQRRLIKIEHEEDKALLIQKHDEEKASLTQEHFKQTANVANLFMVQLEEKTKEISKLKEKLSAFEAKP